MAAPATEHHNNMIADVGDAAEALTADDGAPLHQIESLCMRCGENVSNISCPFFCELFVSILEWGGCWGGFYCLRIETWILGIANVSSLVKVEPNTLIAIVSREAPTALLEMEPSCTWANFVEASKKCYVGYWGTVQLFLLQFLHAVSVVLQGMTRLLLTRIPHFREVCCWNSVLIFNWLLDSRWCISFLSHNCLYALLLYRLFNPAINQVE